MSTTDETIPDELDTELPEGDTFPRDYVEKLRTEAAGHRTKAREAEARVETAVAEAVTPLQQRLHALIVEKTGKLADASDLPFDAAHLDDETALASAIDTLLTAKPHLATRTVSGDVGQGAGEPKETFSLAGMLGARA